VAGHDRGVVRDNGYDGINIDFEAVAAADRNALTSFMTELSARLHAMGKLVSQAVSAKIKDVLNHPRSTAFDYAALSQQVDWVFVMAWGIKYASSTPARRRHPLGQAGRRYVATMPLKAKFVMGTMLYAMDWPAGGGAQHPASAWHYGELTDLAARYSATPVYDAAQDSMHLALHRHGVPHDVYYSDAALVEHRMELARARGLGVGFWRGGPGGRTTLVVPRCSPNRRTAGRTPPERCSRGGVTGDRRARQGAAIPDPLRERVPAAVEHAREERVVSRERRR
jgi:spore germination protein YaaH